MEQRQQNIVCIMEELQKRKIKKKKGKENATFLPAMGKE